jgi:chromosome segregation ATPase
MMPLQPLNPDQEQLRALLAFARFLQDPASFKKYIEELQETLAQYDDVMKVYPTVEAADKYMVEVKAYGERTEAQLIAKDKAQGERIAAFDAQMAKKEAELEGRRAAVRQREAEQNAITVELTRRELALKDAEKIASDRRVAQDERTAKLDARQTELDVKFSKLKALAA